MHPTGFVLKSDVQIKAIGTVRGYLPEAEVAVGAVVEVFGITVFIILMSDNEQVGCHHPDAGSLHEFLFLQ